MKQAGRQRVGGVRVSDSEGDLDRLGVDERGGGGEGAQRAGKILHVVPRGHVVGVAGFQLAPQWRQHSFGRPGSVHLQGARRHDDGCVHPPDSLSAGDAL